MIPRQLHDDAVARRGDGRSPRTTGQEGDFADRRARSDFRDRRLSPRDTHFEAAAFNDEKGVRRLVLVNEHLAARDPDLLEFGSQRRTLHRQQIAEDVDRRQRVIHAVPGHSGSIEGLSGHRIRRFVPGSLAPSV